jgi:hypothetical protein
MPGRPARLKTIDDALASVDPALIAKYPGLAISHQSLLRRRRRLAAADPPLQRVWAASTAATGSAYRLMRVPLQATAFSLLGTARPVFAETGNATCAPRVELWQSSDVRVTATPLNANATGSSRFELVFG